MKLKLALISAAALAVAGAVIAPQLVAAQAPAAQAPAAAARPARPAFLPPNPNEAAPRIPGQNLQGMHVYIRAGLKTHGPGFHDYPQFFADWSKLLTEKGAVVDGSVHFPTPDELKAVDVIVMYKGDTGYMSPTERTTLENYVKRGGGIVLLHDSMCGPDPVWYAEILGGAKRHGETNFSQFPIKYDVVDKASPIMKGFVDGSVLQDEAFFKMTWAKAGVHALATTTFPTNENTTRVGSAGQTVPQIWSYEHTQPGGTTTARAFVWMQGHAYPNIAMPQYRDLVLRGIAWAGKRSNVDELVDYKPPAQPAGRGPQTEADRAISGQ
ncbi:MAG: ThuA domain-containing protein [Caulobacterales bacterium]|nr:ThuA domain-containing protein [Caulobacterales bacterium]